MRRGKYRTRANAARFLRQVKRWWLSLPHIRLDVTPEPVLGKHHLRLNHMSKYSFHLACFIFLNAP